MIPANELRIGNWVQKGQSIWKIEWGAQIDNSDYCYPIPLTPEILERCGFENTHENRWEKNNVELLSRDLPYKDEYLLLNSEERTHWNYVYCYLHQLQNLYFALTGEELTVNLNVEAHQ